jgi:hypothetical protein
MFVLPVYVPSLATKCADVIARYWETLASVQKVMDCKDMGFTFKRYTLVVCLNVKCMQKI